MRKECAAAEAEYDAALKSGAVVQTAPKRGRGAGGGKGSGFFDVVKKAQSSLWEDKFKAFKEKQRGSAQVGKTSLFLQSYTHKIVIEGLSNIVDST